MPISHPDQGRRQLGLSERDTDVLGVKQRFDGRRPGEDQDTGWARWLSVLGAMSTAVALVVLVVWLATV